MHLNKEFKSLTESWLNFDDFKRKFQKVNVEEYPNNVIQAVPRPEISVHIITYQHVLHIRQAIESVLMQKINVPWEIIIGDDDSTDGTREICIEYASKYPDLIRFFMHKRENNKKLFGKPTHLFQYYYNTFNLRGKYFSICSGDDYWTDSNKLQKQYNMFGEHENLSIVYHQWQKLKAPSNTLIDVLGDNHPRIQTVMGFNVFNKIPEVSLEVIQEDSLLRLILAKVGRFKYCSNIKPSVRREGSDNMFFSAGENLRELHQINFKEKVLYNLDNFVQNETKIKFLKSLIKYYFNLIKSKVSRHNFNVKKEFISLIIFSIKLLWSKTKIIK